MQILYHLFAYILVFIIIVRLLLSGYSLILYYMVNLLWCKFLIITFFLFFFLISPKLNVVFVISSMYFII